MYEYPEGLFSRIMTRLGLEKELRLVRGNLHFFGALFGVFLVLSVFALIGVRQVWQESSFGPFLALLASDPSIAVRYWHSFTLSVVESAPGISVALLCFALASLMLFLRMAATATQKIGVLLNSIHTPTHGHQ